VSIHFCVDKVAIGLCSFICPSHIARRASFTMLPLAKTAKRKASPPLEQQDRILWIATADEIQTMSEAQVGDRNASDALAPQSVLARIARASYEFPPRVFVVAARRLVRGRGGPQGATFLNWCRKFGISMVASGRRIQAFCSVVLESLLGPKFSKAVRRPRGGFHVSTARKSSEERDGNREFV